MNGENRIKITKKSVDQWSAYDKVPPTLLKDIQKIGENLFRIRIIHPNKDDAGNRPVLLEKEHDGTFDSAMAEANSCLEQFKDQNIKYEEVKFIPAPRKGSCELYTKENHDKKIKKQEDDEKKLKEKEKINKNNQKKKNKIKWM